MLSQQSTAENQSLACRQFFIQSCLTLAALLAFTAASFAQTTSTAQSPDQPQTPGTDWSQWRGPNRDGLASGATLPASLKEADLKKVWSVPMDPSYSGPIVVGDRIFVTETKDKKYEVVKALDRETGKEIWSTQWEGAMSVPFFAASNGSWIRATPAYEDGRLYVAGMRDVIVCIDAKDGSQIWKVDFPNQMGTSDPSFGFVCSPLIDGNYVYVQAGEAFTKLDKSNGKVVWQSLKDGGGMNGSAFSSPIIATVAGERQAVVQTRTSLCGVDLETGEKLWSQEIPTFRGMNILTPTLFGDSVFTSTYGGTTQLINVSAAGSEFRLKQEWNLPVQGYMSSPVIVNDHAYVHLRNQRYACFDLKNGVEKWRSKPYGKYASLIASGDKILVLDASGELLLLRANPEKFDVIDSRKVGNDSWAHVALSGKDIVVRNLKDVTLFRATK